MSFQGLPLRQFASSFDVPETSQYRGVLGDWYFALNELDFWTHEFIESLAPESGLIIDLMCGRGRLVRSVTEGFHERVGIGIDIDPVVVKEATGLSRSVRFEVGDVFEWTLHERAAMVLLGGLGVSMFCRDDRRRLFQRIQLLCRPGTIFYFEYLPDLGDRYELRSSALPLFKQSGVVLTSSSRSVVDGCQYSEFLALTPGPDGVRPEFCSNMLYLARPGCIEAELLDLGFGIVHSFPSYLPFCSPGEEVVESMAIQRCVVEYRGM